MAAHTLTLALVLLAALAARGRASGGGPPALEAGGGPAQGRAGASRRGMEERACEDRFADPSSQASLRASSDNVFFFVQGGPTLNELESCALASAVEHNPSHRVYLFSNSVSCVWVRDRVSPRIRVVRFRHEDVFAPYPRLAAVWEDVTRRERSASSTFTLGDTLTSPAAERDAAAGGAHHSGRGGSSAHLLLLLLTDALRVALLHAYGGTSLDADVLSLRTLDGLEAAVGTTAVGLTTTKEEAAAAAGGVGGGGGSLSNGKGRGGGGWWGLSMSVLAFGGRREGGERQGAAAGSKWGGGGGRSRGRRKESAGSGSRLDDVDSGSVGSSGRGNGSGGSGQRRHHPFLAQMLEGYGSSAFAAATSSSADAEETDKSWAEPVPDGSRSRSRILMRTWLQYRGRRAEDDVLLAPASEFYALSSLAAAAAVATENGDGGEEEEGWRALISPVAGEGSGPALALRRTLRGGGVRLLQLPHPTRVARMWEELRRHDEGQEPAEVEEGGATRQSAAEGTALWHIMAAACPSLPSLTRRTGRGGSTRKENGGERSPSIAGGSTRGAAGRLWLHQTEAAAEGEGSGGAVEGEDEGALAAAASAQMTDARVLAAMSLPSRHAADAAAEEEGEEEVEDASYAPRPEARFLAPHGRHHYRCDAASAQRLWSAAAGAPDADAGGGAGATDARQQWSSSQLPVYALSGGRAYRRVRRSGIFRPGLGPPSPSLVVTDSLASVGVQGTFKLHPCGIRCSALAVEEIAAPLPAPYPSFPPMCGPAFLTPGSTPLGAAGGQEAVSQVTLSLWLSTLPLDTTVREKTWPVPSETQPLEGGAGGGDGRSSSASTAATSFPRTSPAAAGSLAHSVAAAWTARDGDVSIIRAGGLWGSGWGWWASALRSAGKAGDSAAAAAAAEAAASATAPFSGASWDGPGSANEVESALDDESSSASLSRRRRHRPVSAQDLLPHLSGGRAGDDVLVLAIEDGHITAGGLASEWVRSLAPVADGRFHHIAVQITTRSAADGSPASFLSRGRRHPSSIVSDTAPLPLPEDSMGGRGGGASVSSDTATTISLVVDGVLHASVEVLGASAFRAFAVGAHNAPASIFVDEVGVFDRPLAWHDLLAVRNAQLLASARRDCLPSVPWARPYWPLDGVADRDDEMGSAEEDQGGDEVPSSADAPLPAPTNTVTLAVLVLSDSRQSSVAARALARSTWLQRGSAATNTDGDGSSSSGGQWAPVGGQRGRAFGHGGEEGDDEEEEEEDDDAYGTAHSFVPPPATVSVRHHFCLSRAGFEAARVEASRYQDLLPVDAPDTYSSLARKVWVCMRALLARYEEAGERFEFLLKTDHDVFTRVDVVGQEAAAILASRGASGGGAGGGGGRGFEHSASSSASQGRMIYYWRGFVYRSVPPLRDLNDKNADVDSTFMTFPPFTAGVGYVLSRPLVEEIVSLPRPFDVLNEDQAIGIWMVQRESELGLPHVEPVHDIRFQQWSVCTSPQLAFHPAGRGISRQLAANLRSGEKEVCEAIPFPSCCFCCDCPGMRTSWFVCDRRGAWLPEHAGVEELAGLSHATMLLLQKASPASLLGAVEYALGRGQAEGGPSSERAALAANLRRRAWRPTKWEPLGRGFVAPASDWAPHVDAWRGFGAGHQWGERSEEDAVGDDRRGVVADDAATVLATGIVLTCGPTVAEADAAFTGAGSQDMTAGEAADLAGRTFFPALSAEAERICATTTALALSAGEVDGADDASDLALHEAAEERAARESSRRQREALGKEKPDDGPDGVGGVGEEGESATSSSARPGGWDDPWGLTREAFCPLRASSSAAAALPQRPVQSVARPHWLLLSALVDTAGGGGGGGGGDGGGAVGGGGCGLDGVDQDVRDSFTAPTPHDLIYRRNARYGAFAAFCGLLVDVIHADGAVSAFRSPFARSARTHLHHEALHILHGSPVRSVRVTLAVPAAMRNATANPSSLWGSRAAVLDLSVAPLVLPPVAVHPRLDLPVVREAAAAVADSDPRWALWVPPVGVRGRHRAHVLDPCGGRITGFAAAWLLVVVALALGRLLGVALPVSVWILASGGGPADAAVGAGCNSLARQLLSEVGLLPGSSGLSWWCLAGSRAGKGVEDVSAKTT